MLASFHSTVCVFEDMIKTFIHALLKVLEHTPDGCFGVLVFASAELLSLGSVAVGFAGFRRRHTGCSFSRTDYPESGRSWCFLEWISLLGGRSVLRLLLP